MTLKEFYELAPGPDALEGATIRAPLVIAKDPETKAVIPEKSQYQDMRIDAERAAMWAVAYSEHSARPGSMVGDIEITELPELYRNPKDRYCRWCRAKLGLGYTIQQGLEEGCCPVHGRNPPVLHAGTLPPPMIRPDGTFWDSSASTTATELTPLEPASMTLPPVTVSSSSSVSVTSSTFNPETVKAGYEAQLKRALDIGKEGIGELRAKTPTWAKLAYCPKCLGPHGEDQECFILSNYSPLATVIELGRSPALAVAQSLSRTKDGSNGDMDIGEFKHLLCEKCASPFVEGEEHTCAEAFDPKTDKDYRQEIETFERMIGRPVTEEELRGSGSHEFPCPDCHQPTKYLMEHRCPERILVGQALEEDRRLYQALGRNTH